MQRLGLALILLLAPLAAAVPGPRAQQQPAPLADAALAIDGERIPLDLYARWLLRNFGERAAQTFARDHVAVEQAAREAGVEVDAEACAGIVDAALAERIEKAFFGQCEGWLAELARTGRTEAGVRLQMETQTRPLELARGMAAIGRVVPEHKIVREWEQRHGRNGRRYELLMTKVLVVVPSRERETREEWERERQRVLDQGLERARAVRARIAAGEDFGRVARETSDDPGTRDGRGVPPGGFTHAGWPASFLDALERLAPGDLSEPLFARGGWWVVRVLSVESTPLDAVRDELEARLAARGPEDDEIGAVLERLRGAAHFRLLPALFEDGRDPELEGPGAPVLEVNGEGVTRAEFTRWLLAVQAESSLQRFVEDWAIEREAGRREIEVGEAELEERTRQNLALRIAEGHKGSREAWNTYLALNGRTEESFLFSLRERTRTDLLVEKMLLADREVTPEAVRARYVSEYGPEGERLTVRWIVTTIQVEAVDRNWTREQFTAALQAASERARVKLTDLVQRARAGEDFAGLAREHSADAPTRERGGLIEGRFRSDAYPEAFGAAVHALQPGAVTDALEHGTAWVAFQLVERHRASFEEARAELERELAAQRPSWNEVNAQRNALAQRCKVEILPGLSAR
jgi:parvulin-like peptidyl-prolyl isomerase